MLSQTNAVIFHVQLVLIILSLLAFLNVTNADDNSTTTTTTTTTTLKPETESCPYDYDYYHKGNKAEEEDNTETETEAPKNKTAREAITAILSQQTTGLPPAYDTNEATEVAVQLFFVTIDCIDQSTMDFSVTLLLQMTWEDHRLTFDEDLYGTDMLEIAPQDIDNIWVPDIYFVNSKRSFVHLVTFPNKMMHINPNGTIVYSMRVSLLLLCHMDLRSFPFDSQICDIIMESISYSSKLVKVKWHETPFILRKKMSLPTFLVRDTKTYNTINCYPGLPCYSSIKCSFYIDRGYTNYLAQVYVPSGLIVCLSWVSFWLDVESTPARITLGLLTVLTMTTQTSDARIHLPRVSYIKAIDIWMGVCLLFVFGALLEFAIVNVQARLEDWGTLDLRSLERDTIIRSSLEEQYVNQNIVFQDDEDSQILSSSSSSSSSSVSLLDFEKGLNEKRKRNFEKSDSTSTTETHEKENNAKPGQPDLNKPVSSAVDVKPSKDRTNTKDVPNDSKKRACKNKCCFKIRCRKVSEDTNKVSFSSAENNIRRARKIDYISRIGFPLMFAGFNIFYWVFYLIIWDAAK